MDNQCPQGKRRVFDTDETSYSLYRCKSFCPNSLKIPNATSFKRIILNIGTFKNSILWRGKKGVVVGSATGAHDVAQDMLDSGLSVVTMIQREKTPIFPMEWCAEIQSRKECVGSFFKAIS